MIQRQPLSRPATSNRPSSSFPDLFRAEKGSGREEMRGIYRGCRLLAPFWTGIESASGVHLRIVHLLYMRLVVLNPRCRRHGSCALWPGGGSRALHTDETYKIAMSCGVCCGRCTLLLLRIVGVYLDCQ